jgi:hypothetical protein
MDIKNNKIFNSWLNKNWFTKLEMAMVQPTYNRGNIIKKSILDILLYIYILYIIILLILYLHLIYSHLMYLRESKDILKEKLIIYIKKSLLWGIIFISLYYIFITILELFKI